MLGLNCVINLHVFSHHRLWNLKEGNGKKKKKKKEKERHSELCVHNKRVP